MNSQHLGMERNSPGLSSSEKILSGAEGVRLERLQLSRLSAEELQHLRPLAVGQGSGLSLQVLLRVLRCRIDSLR